MSTKVACLVDFCVIKLLLIFGFAADKYDDLLRRNRELAKSNSHLSKRYVEVHNRMNKDGNSYRLEIQMVS